MNKDEFIFRYRNEMDDVKVSPQLRRRTLEAAMGKHRSRLKKRSIVILAALLVLLLGAAGIAAVYRAGMLDFAGRFMGSYVPKDAQAYVQTDLLTMENDLIRAEVKELYYDGSVSRITVDVKARDSRTMLLGMDMAPDDNWQNMFRLSRTWDETDKRTAADVYAQGNDLAAYAVEARFELDGIDGGSSDYHLNEDGTLTLYLQQEYTDALPVRSGIFYISLTPYQTPLAQNSATLPELQIKLECPLEMTEAEFAKEVRLSTESKAFESVGIRVDEIRVEKRAHEIHATITGIIINRGRYEAQGNGLWFEFIDPSSTADQPHLQRLKSGLTASGSVDQFGDCFKQHVTLGREEMHDTYTIRAYNMITKERYETQTFTMKQPE